MGVLNSIKGNDEGVDNNEDLNIELPDFELSNEPEPIKEAEPEIKQDEYIAEKKNIESKSMLNMKFPKKEIARHEHKKLKMHKNLPKHIKKLEEKVKKEKKHAIQHLTHKPTKAKKHELQKLIHKKLSFEKPISKPKAEPNFSFKKTEQITSSNPSLINERQIALEFAAKVQKRFSDMIKATVLFGSQTKGEASSSSDIDIVIIIDDASIKWDLELISWYREELAKLVAACKYPRELHINTIKLTTWWNDLMHGDPVVINILRYGEALIDIGGFFNPLKALLLDGKIHSTPEAVYSALQRAPMHLARSNFAELSAIEGIYWTMVDSA